MFNDIHFRSYLVKLFSMAGLWHWLDAQGLWTITLFPSTSGGRYFTLNIGSHEVAFSTLPGKKERPVHMVYMDELILNYPNSIAWIENHGGAIEKGSYKTAMPHAVSVWFEGSFEDSIELLGLEGMRRAIIAYWTERLVVMKEEDKLSSFARFHNYNAVSELIKLAREDVS